MCAEEGKSKTHKSRTVCAKIDKQDAGTENYGRMNPVYSLHERKNAS